MIWTPRVTVAAVIEQQGRFLLVEETAGGRRVLNQPAGHLEDGEGLLEAAVRETLEETAWRFTPEALVGVYRWRNPVDGVTFLRFAFTGACTDHDHHRALDPDILRLVWLTPDELRARRAALRSPLVLRAVTDYLAGCRYPLSLLSDIVATG